MLRQRFFKWLARLCFERHMAVLACALAATALLGTFALRLEINLGMLNLLSDENPEVARVNYVNENFGGMDYLFITVTADRPDRARDFANRLGARLREIEDKVLRVTVHMDIDSFYRHALLFLEPGQIRDLGEFLKENEGPVREVFDDVRMVPFLTGMNDLLESRIIEEEGIEDAEEAMDSLEALGSFLDATREALEQGEAAGSGRIRSAVRGLLIPPGEADLSALDEDYIASEDGKTLLVLLMPSQPGDDFVFNNALLADVDRAVEEIRKDSPEVTVRLTGNIAIMRDEHRALIHDTYLSSAVSAVLVLVIFLVFFRKLSDLLLIATCLGSGVVWTYGFTYFGVGYLSITTTFFSAILIGLGIDFAIHVVARYGEALRSGRDVRGAVEDALVGAGPGILTGAATTSTAFYVLTIARFKGIAQLGFVAGTGMLCMLGIMLTVLPSLLVLRDHRLGLAARSARAGELAFMGRLASYMVRHRLPVLIAITACTALLAFAAGRIRFNYDYRSIEPRNSPAIETSDWIEQRFGHALDYSLIYADTLDQERELVEKAKACSTVTEVDHVSQLVPEGQQARIREIRAIAPQVRAVKAKRRVSEGEQATGADVTAYAEALEGTERVLLAVKQLAIVGGDFEVEDRSGELRDQARNLAGWVRQRGDALAANATFYQASLGRELAFLVDSLHESAEGRMLTLDDLPRQVRDHYIGEDGRLLIYAFPGEHIWEESRMKDHYRDIKTVTPEATGVAVIFLTVIEEIKQDFRTAVIYALAAVFLLVLADFRRPLTAVLALIPLVAGATWMVGAMVLLGMSFNIINAAVVPLIIGIGVDNGVHILHRYRREGKDKVRMAVEHTGRAIFLSAVTTMAGFGSLGLASYVALATLGQVLVLGVGFCLVTAVIVLPIVLSYLGERFRI